jgi:hypothetical protein
MSNWLVHFHGAKIMKFKLTRSAVIKQDIGRSSKAINQPIFGHPATSIRYIQSEHPEPIQRAK